MGYVSRVLRKLKASTRHRALRRPKTTRFLKRWSWGSEEIPCNYIMDNKELFLGASDLSDYITSQIVIERNKALEGTHHHTFTVIATRKEWITYIDGLDMRPVQFSGTSGIIINDSGSSYLKYSITSSAVEIDLYGDEHFVDSYYTQITDIYEEVTNVIEWIYGSDGQSIEIPVRSDRKPIDEMYPFLNGRTLENYYDSFMNSNASILLLIGPPGTGKTTFIRGLLQHTETSAMVTYDAAILSKDYMFANFIEGNRNVMIIEDADNFLGNRSDGNDFMHKFLNVGDGLVTTKNKKMIFSTNLPSIRDVDPALIRPGRCFDILHFDNLDDNQAAKLAAKLDVSYDIKDSGKYSIAEIFHKQVDKPRAPRRPVGFV